MPTSGDCRKPDVHVIAISGGNIAILAAMLLGLQRLCGVATGTSAGLTIVVLLFYGYLASGGASVARAVTAACVYLGGRMIDQRGPALNALAVAASVGLASSPLSAVDGGFILSFGATLGILIGVPQVHRLCSSIRTEIISSSSADDARSCVPRDRASRKRSVDRDTLRGTCPDAGECLVFLADHRRGAGAELSGDSVDDDRAVGGDVVFATAAAPSQVGYTAGYVTHLAASGLIRSAALVDFARWSTQSIVTPASWVIAAYYGFCSLLFTRRWRRVGVAGLAAAFVVMLVPPWFARPVSPPRAGALRVVFLDVGQGDSTLIELPDGHFLLVDAGGVPGTGFDIGERVVLPALLAFGVRSLDTLVLTHGDPDHIGGAPAVLRHFSLNEVWEGVPVPPHAGLRDLISTALHASVAWRTVQAADRELSGGAEIRVLHPPVPDWDRQRVRNEDSIVLEIRLGNVSIVLPGDIGREAEQRITPHLATAPITVIKAPHHGSATSSTQDFITALHPAAVVFSAGRGNHFGHPAPVVVDRYRAAHAVILRTDEDGAIVMDTDGRTVEISTWSREESQVAVMFRVGSIHCPAATSSRP